MRSRFRTRPVAGFLLLVVVAIGCTGPDSVVEPGPADDEPTTTTANTTTVVEDVETSDIEEPDETTNIETAPPDTSPETTTTVAANTEQQAANESASREPGAERPEVFEVVENSENAAVFVELADSGLVLTIEEQSCADDTAGSAVDDGSTELDAIIDAVRTCAAPVAIDNFASDLIIAGGAGLPADEAACVSSRLQSGDEYRTFWAALLEEEQFDFLLSDLEVQNRYLDLYAECVSVGRAVGDQAAVTLSAPTVGCIDDLYQDREFVRVTIEADLSGNAEDQERVSNQIATCLNADERLQLGLG